MSRKIVLDRMRRSKFFVIGAVFVVLIVAVAMLAPALSPYDPIANSLTERLNAPSGSHVLGTDELGRDVFSRLLEGARASLGIAAAVVFMQVVLGTTLGLIAGYLGGVLDTVIMRLCDIFLALPSMLVAIAIMSVLGANTLNLIIILTLTGWVQFCRLTRNNVLVIRGQEFVQASRALGASKLHIMFTQVIQNVTTPIIVMASQKFGFIISMEATLSFLSLGIQPPAPSWGNMISAGRSFIATCPWLVFAPGIALMVTVLAFNFLGDGLRDVLDPKKL